MKKNAEINVAKANQAADIVAVQANETKLVGSKFTAMQAELTALPNVMTQVRKQLCPLVTMTHHYDSSIELLHVFDSQCYYRGAICTPPRDLTNHFVVR